MTEREILALTYKDCCCIYRRVNSKSGSITTQSEQLIADNVPCALSQSKNSASPGQYTSVNNTYLLFAAPDLDIRAGDKVIVTCQSGRIKNCLTAEPFIYSNSHLEAVLTEEGKA